ncbi:ATP-binding protein [Streptomyces triculaminicus]|uniref:ATP-binding protein n=1 Tax=Streptomyces triculaminicus TaxID=2816232 RepID=UPI0033FF2EFF
MAIHTRHSERQLRMELAPRPSELAIVRRIARTQLLSWGLATETEDVLTVVNELLTNVIDHVPGARTRTRCTLTLAPKAYLLHVRVRDSCRAMPVKQEPAADRTSGRGLALVDSLTHGRWKVVLPPLGEGKEIHCLFDISGAAPPPRRVQASDIVREIFRYRLARSDHLPHIIRHTHAACDHLATGETCTRHCLTVTIGSVVRSGLLVRFLDGALTRQDSSPAAAACRITAEGTGLPLEPESAAAPPLWIEERRTDGRSGRQATARLHFWYLFDAPPAYQPPPKDRATWMPLSDLPPTPLRGLIRKTSPRGY